MHCRSTEPARTGSNVWVRAADDDNNMLDYRERCRPPSYLAVGTWRSRDLSKKIKAEPVLLLLLLLLECLER